MMRDMVTGQGCMPDDSEAARNPMANMMNAMAQQRAMGVSDSRATSVPPPAHTHPCTPPTPL